MWICIPDSRDIDAFKIMATWYTMWVFIRGSTDISIFEINVKGYTASGHTLYSLDDSELIQLFEWVHTGMSAAPLVLPVYIYAMRCLQSGDFCFV